MGIKYKVDEKFFDTWSSDMAYLLGYMYADGSLENAPYLRGKYIRVSSTDKTTIEKIKKLLQSEHPIVSLFPTSKNPGKTRYFLRIGSHKLYNSLIKLGIYPNKSLSVKFPSHLKEKFVSDFIRGYFDGDGCVNLYLAKGKTQRKIVKKLSIIFTSGSLDFLKGLGQRLTKILVLKHNKIYTHSNGRTFQLRYSTKDSLKLCEFFYANLSQNSDLFLKRKLDTFKKYFKLRPVKINGIIKEILLR